MWTLQVQLKSLKSSHYPKKGNDNMKMTESILRYLFYQSFNLAVSLLHHCIPDRNMFFVSDAISVITEENEKVNYDLKGWFGKHETHVFL